MRLIDANDLSGFIALMQNKDDNQYLARDNDQDEPLFNFGKSTGYSPLGQIPEEGHGSVLGNSEGVRRRRTSNTVKWMSSHY